MPSPKGKSTDDRTQRNFSTCQIIIHSTASKLIPKAEDLACVEAEEVKGSPSSKCFLERKSDGKMIFMKKQRDSIFRNNI